MLYIIQQQEIVTDDIDDSNSILALGISFINKKISDIDNTKEYKKIIEDYTKALSINKENADTYNKRGLIEKGLKQYQEALQDFDNAVKFDKDNNKEYYFNRGEIKIFLGQGKESISDFDKAIEIDPKYAQAYYYRAAQYQTIGQKAKAKADFKKAKELGYISKSEEDRDLLLATIVALIIIAGIHFITKIPSKKIF